MLPVVLLHPDDTILVCRAPIAAGDQFVLDGQTYLIGTPIEVGHKLARFDLKGGDKIVKYGAPIGSLTEDAAKGAHVHLHNMKSDYIATHTRQGIV